MRRTLALTTICLLGLALGAAACSDTAQQKAAIGEPCDPAKKGAECADNFCLPLDNASGLCSRGCGDDGKCPEGFKCEDAGKYGLVCKRPPLCTEDLDCPSGHRCDPDSGTCYIKVKRGLCSPCTNDKQCPDGGGCFTAPASGERYCTGPCAEDGGCPTGFVCKDVPFLKIGAPPELKKQCVPDNREGTCEGGRPLCAPCKGDEECGGFLDVCVRNVVSGERFCGKNCTPGHAGDCPAAFGCVDISGKGDGPFQCVPNSNTCAGYCSATDEHEQLLQCGLGRSCDLKNQACIPANDGRECSPCRDDDECRKPGHESNQCVVNNCTDCPAKGETFCAEPCPAVDGDKDCKARFGPGFACTKVGDQNFCVPQRGSCVSGLGLLGDSCVENGAKDCVTSICLSYGKTALCSTTCTTDASCGDVRKFRCCDVVGDFYDCSGPHRNASGTGPASGGGVCAPAGGLFGDDCAPGRPQCQSGTCLDIGTARLCTIPCGEGDRCPEDFVCREAFPEGAASATPVKICFPDGGGAPGSECKFGPAACADRLCIKKASGNICTRPCPNGDECPPDWECKDVDTVTSERARACVPPELQ